MINIRGGDLARRVAHDRLWAQVEAAEQVYKRDLHRRRQGLAELRVVDPGRFLGLVQLVYRRVSWVGHEAGDGRRLSLTAEVPEAAESLQVLPSRP